MNYMQILVRSTPYGVHLTYELGLLPTYLGTSPHS